MDPRHYKCPAFRHVSVAGEIWEIRAIPQNKIDVAHMTAQELSRGSAETYRHLEDMIQVVSVAAGVAPHHIRKLYTEQLIRLYKIWGEVQDASIPNSNALDAKLRLAVMDDGVMCSDGATANASRSAMEYYGKPVSELTFGQIVYFITLKTVYYEMYIDDTNKKVSRAWLERQAKNI